MNDSWRRLKNAGYRTRLYRYSLERRQAERLAFLPQDPWPGDLEQANELFRGRYRFAGREASAPNQPPWRLRPEDPEWLSELHSFEWLRHFEAAGGDTARSQARRLVRSWIDLCGDIDLITWAPGTMGRRLTSWLGHGHFLLKGGDEAFADAYLASITVQWQHLQRTLGDADFGSDQFSAVLGLVYGAMSLSNNDSALEKYLQQIETLISTLILSDGGYFSRAPSDSHRALRRMIALRDGMEQRGMPIPGWLLDTIAIMVPQLRGLRHGDGGLALFNGGFEEDSGKVDITLEKAGVKGKALLSATQSGFQRLTAGRAILLAETGAPPRGVSGRNAHSGGGAFELSIGNHRLVVNCGSGRYRNQDWREAARATAAHSTLHIGNANAWPIFPDGGFGTDPARLHCRRHEDEFGNVWLELHHGGYLERFGLIHRRRLYLAATGADIRGEDCLEAKGPEGIATGAGAHPVVVRFHLHPDVQASALHGGSAVLLRLADGQGWRFRASGAEITMADSIYMGKSDRIRRGQQIVLSTTTSPENTQIKWAFQQV
ncbi:MAG: hypothetical protein HN732_26260 [Rhodospirillaceae bacterium]|jgi:uncharacterized heparinase superfamily protein|nr:hypothetical protein [Rhodospirillaceae bacterium]MBT7760864.1 hypothetical protein [Rhodospirillaceae bacterium]